MRKDRMNDEAVYTALVERHRGEMQARSRQMLGSPHDADDAVQDALLRAWRFLPQYDGTGSVRGWLYRIVTNASLDVMKRRDPPVPVDEEGPVAGPEAEPHRRYERREEVKRALLTADRMLTDRQRAVLLLRDVLGFSARETAERLQISVASVNSALQRARAALDG
jgi:RNA polymerase sigma-70 factor (ECF subfamily)